MIPGEALLVRILGGIAIAGALWAGYSWQMHRADKRGYDRATGEWVKKEQAISDAAEAKYAKRLEDALELNKLLNAQMAEREKVRAAWEKEHEKTVNAAISRALAGTERLSIRTVPAACPVPGAAAPGTAAAAGPAGPDQRADLVPEVAAEFVRIGAASARDMRDYNDLLEEYRALRGACQK